MVIELKAIIQLAPQKPVTGASPEQIKVLRSFQNFYCVQDAKKELFPSNP